MSKIIFDSGISDAAILKKKRFDGLRPSNHLRGARLPQADGPLSTPILSSIPLLVVK